MTIKLYHISNHSGLIELKYCNVLYFGIIISLIQQICMKAFNLAGCTKFPGHGGQGLESPVIQAGCVAFGTFDILLLELFI